MAETLKKLISDDWNFEMINNPEFAFQAGFKMPYKKGEYCLQDVSTAGYAARKEHSLEMIRLFTQTINVSELSKDDAFFAKLFIKMHTELVESIDNCPLYQIAINSMGAGGAVFSFIESVEWMPFETAEDYESYLWRLRSAPTQYAQFQSAMKDGAKNGIVASTAMLRHVESQLEGIVKGDLPELHSPLNNPVAETVLTDGVKADIIAAIADVKTAITKFLDWFHDEYLALATFNPACSSLPNGAKIYESCLKYHTTTTLTPDEIHAIGLSEVERIENRYKQEVLVPLGYGVDGFPQFVEFIGHDKQFYVATPDELLTFYRTKCAEISAILPQYFNEIPKSPLEIVSKTVGPCAYYIAGTVDGKRPGRFYVNCSEIEKRPTYEGVALSLHEANPGHHHQCAITIENNNLPNFVRFLEDRRYEVGSARRNMCTAYIEGWGLYTEFLGEEMGLYKTPYELFGRFSMEMMRAVRLVVDTGIHAKGWSIEKAIDYMMAKTGMHRHEVETEIYRYATWPGQACAYKIGEIAIRRIRKSAEERLGAKFSVKDFHSVVLQYGPIPLSTLEEVVNEYVEETLNK